MIFSWIYPIIATLLVGLFSLVGALVILVNERLTKKNLLFFVSFAAGGLLGDVFIHLLPEMSEKEGINLNSSLAILAGLLIFFILEKFIHWRHCHVPTSKQHLHPLVFMNLVGDGLHNFIDGVVIAGSFLTSTSLGIATTLAVVFHEIPQEIGDFGVLLHGGLGKRRVLIFNFIFSLTAVLGAIFALVLSSKIESFSTYLIPFTVGGFIYIAGSDLIPELHKETRPAKSLMQLLGLVIGIGIMLILKIFG